jgi:hypothetical protein
MEERKDGRPGKDILTKESFKKGRDYKNMVQIKVRIDRRVETGVYCKPKNLISRKGIIERW